MSTKSERVRERKYLRLDTERSKKPKILLYDLPASLWVTLEWRRKEEGLREV